MMKFHMWVIVLDDYTTILSINIHPQCKIEFELTLWCALESQSVCIFCGAPHMHVTYFVSDISLITHLQNYMHSKYVHRTENEYFCGPAIT